VRPRTKSDCPPVQPDRRWCLDLETGCGSRARVGHPPLTILVMMARLFLGGLGSPGSRLRPHHGRRASHLPKRHAAGFLPHKGCRSTAPDHSPR
jgi:hypothetical protein